MASKRLKSRSKYMSRALSPSIFFFKPRQEPRPCLCFTPWKGPFDHTQNTIARPLLIPSPLRKGWHLIPTTSDSPTSPSA
jgi:hypothetical protein